MDAASAWPSRCDQFRSSSPNLGVVSKARQGGSRIIQLYRPGVQRRCDQRRSIRGSWRLVALQTPLPGPDPELSHDEVDECAISAPPDKMVNAELLLKAIGPN